ncbi:MAG: RDD family protein [Terriglobia bacterium]
MRCPECGNVSFAGLPACKKCGYPLEHVAKAEQQPFPSQTPVPLPLQSDSSSRPQAPAPEIDQELTTGFLPTVPASPEQHHSPEAGFGQRQAIRSAAPALPDEAGEKVARFRHRTARSDKPLEMSLTLNFDATRGDSPLASRAAPQAEAMLDRAFEEQSSRGRQPSLQSIDGALAATPIKRPPAPIDRGARATSGVPHAPGSAGSELEWDSALFTRQGERSYSELAAAPLGARFLAGAIDALVLLIVAGFFIAALTLAGGAFNSGLVDWAVALFDAAFWIFLYFSLFTLFAFRTPGQSAMKLWVRNLDGAPPAPPEAFLRGFGYVISVATLMLGFLWAAMDSDGMAWHDHISGTILVEHD